jgi:hypothetical protein
MDELINGCKEDRPRSAGRPPTECVSILLDELLEERRIKFFQTGNAV